MVLTGSNILLWIAVACFAIAIIIAVVDFATDGNFSDAGIRATIVFFVLAVIVVIVAVILGRVH